MKKILIGFIAIGLLTFVGCGKEEDDFTTAISIEHGEGATDIDGNTYKSVIIGAQEWMAENLRTTKYSDGTTIPNVTGDTEWNNDTIGAWCHYNNDDKYEDVYGKLYNWHAVETGKLCPVGWHVPTDAEWGVLINYLTANGHRGKEGTALKATSGWDNKDDGTSGNGTDDYGWNGLPGGYRYNDGFFNYIGSNGYWWSSSQKYTYSAWFRNMYYNDDFVSRGNDYKRYGFSVRCLRD